MPLFFFSHTGSVLTLKFNNECRFWEKKKITYWSAVFALFSSLSKRLQNVVNLFSAPGSLLLTNLLYIVFFSCIFAARSGLIQSLRIFLFCFTCTKGNQSAYGVSYSSFNLVQEGPVGAESAWIIHSMQALLTPPYSRVLVHRTSVSASNIQQATRPKF